jgi:hypothetical protein
VINHSAQSGQHSFADRKLDCYPTPLVAIKALLRVVQPPKIVRDPCCGVGGITLPLRAAGHTVIASDLIARGCPDSLAGIDFLTERVAFEQCECVLMNPPY